MLKDKAAERQRRAASRLGEAGQAAARALGHPLHQGADVDEAAHQALDGLPGEPGLRQGEEEALVLHQEAGGVLGQLVGLVRVLGVGLHVG
mgnify:CR=1 FL=1